MNRYDLVIINRSFWPIYPVIGEGLLRLAESIAPIKKVAIITQDHSNINRHLKESGRGVGVKFFLTWAFSNSSSNFFKRILDTLFFMFWVLIVLFRARPKKIYISTDPPVLVPFIVAIYSKIMSAKYFYHLQDIHPEATNVVFKFNYFLISILKKIDNFTMRHASLLITLNEQMKSVIVNRSNTQKHIAIIENPSVQFNNLSTLEKTRGFSFTGNLGRLQRIPLLVDAIKQYLQKGGALEFAFAGGGVFANEIFKLSKDNSLIKYYGVVPPDKAASISNKYEWALAPIENQITQYAFPSKLSSYACSGAKILAICSEDTSVAQWVKKNQVGIIVKPTIGALIDIFSKIEKNNIDNTSINLDRKELIKNLSMDKFVNNIRSKIFP